VRWHRLWYARPKRPANQPTNRCRPVGNFDRKPPTGHLPPPAIEREEEKGERKPITPDYAPRKRITGCCPTGPFGRRFDGLPDQRPKDMPGAIRKRRRKPQVRDAGPHSKPSQSSLSAIRFLPCEPEPVTTAFCRSLAWRSILAGRKLPYGAFLWPTQGHSSKPWWSKARVLIW